MSKNKISTWINKRIKDDVFNIDNRSETELLTLRKLLEETKQFFTLFFLETTKILPIHFYTEQQKKGVKSNSLLIWDPIGHLETGWILSKDSVFFCFNSEEYRDISITYKEMSKVPWVKTNSFFSTKCSFCSPSGFYIGVPCERMETFSIFFKAYPKQETDWINFINDRIRKIESVRSKQLQNVQSNFLSELDKDGNGQVDLIDGESFNKLLNINQRKIIEIDKSYIQKFVKISSYLKTKKENTQKIFEHIKKTKNQSELSELINLLKNQIHTYELLVFHSLNMITSLTDDELITFYEIYECFDQLGVFNSSWENEVSNKLTEIGDGIKDLMYSINRMEYNIVSSINNLTYVTEDSYKNLSNSVERQLSNINSSIKFNNLLTGIQTYQMYKINQNTKGIG
ncbi:MAG: hypothetical protein ACKO7P_04475 [Bacteroidota bacterium]